MLLLGASVAVIFLLVLLWAISSELNRIRLSIDHLSYSVSEVAESLNNVAPYLDPSHEIADIDEPD